MEAEVQTDEAKPVLAAGLSKMDVRALRDADEVTFFASHDAALERASGRLRIVAHKRVERVGPFDERERTYEILHGRAVFDTYKEALVGKTVAVGDAHGYNREWQTVRRLLKEGDELKARVSVNGGNEYCQRAGLYVDRMFLEVSRKGQLVYSFLVDESICPDNSARMVRPQVVAS